MRILEDKNEETDLFILENKRQFLEKIVLSRQLKDKKRAESATLAEKAEDEKRAKYAALADKLMRDIQGLDNNVQYVNKFDELRLILSRLNQFAYRTSQITDADAVQACKNIMRQQPVSTKQYKIDRQNFSQYERNAAEILFDELDRKLSGAHARFVDQLVLYYISDDKDVLKLILMAVEYYIFYSELTQILQQAGRQYNMFYGDNVATQARYLLCQAALQDIKVVVQIQTAKKKFGATNADEARKILFFYGARITNKSLI